ncbi:MAG: 3-hydroxybenzoate 4-monooxygenase [Actinomycetaceae bacterium]|nr:3-hydroxybenzoate 4-monooxygenase [Actinomycetaceae bacterium]
MQFHHHGYISEDPRVKLADESTIRSPELPDQMDVLIVGAGPAGMITAAQLSVFPDIHARIIESRDGRLPLGHADGIAARSVETFQAFGFAEEIIEEGYRITETAFWKPDPENPDHIARTAWTDDDPSGLSEFPHLVVNQARVLDYYRRFMERQPTRMPVNFGWALESLEVQDGEYPVACHIIGTGAANKDERRTVYAKYVLGADGARSKVRESIGANYSRVISNHAWGVADVLVDTNFPDAMTKAIINSNHGSILHIPREGGYLFRSYVDLGDLDADDNHEIRNTPLEEIVAKANKIMAPYSYEVKETAWWSVYEVGHRVTERFDDVLPENRETQDPRVFIAGDACHTHSAKAGQGMNVSMQDGFNLAWKLAQVLRGYSSPSLLRTYNSERQPVAQDLIDFDLEWSGRMAAGEKSTDEAIENFYVRTWEFPAGFRTQYPPALLVASDAKQELATGYPLGKRFKSYRVMRRSDAHDLGLGHLHEADGRWRIYVFADEPNAAAQDSKLRAFGDWLGNDPNSPVVRHTREGDDINSVFDVKVIYQQPHREFELGDAPEIFRPRVGKWQLEDKNQVFGIISHPNIEAMTDSLGPRMTNMFPKEDIFEARGISRDGAVVVVRPDMYVAHICSLEDTESLANFFEPIFDLS